MRKWTSRLFKLAGLLVVLLVLLFTFIQTPPGKSVLARALSGALSSPGKLTVRLSGISGWLPAQVRIEELELADAQGTWLAMEGVECRWILRDLLAKRLTFRELGAEQIHWSRFPDLGGEAPKPRKRRVDFRPVEVRLQELQIERLRVGKGVAGMELEYSIASGGMAYRSDGGLSGELEVAGDAEGHVELQASITGSTNDHLRVDADLRRMHKPTFGLDYLAGKGEATIDAQGVDAVIAADLSKGGQQGRITTRLSFADRHLALEQFEFNSPEFSLSGDLGLGFRKGAINVDLASSFVDVNTNQYSLQGTATVATSNKVWGVEVAALEVAAWDVVAFNLSGTLSPEAVDLHGSLEEFDIGTFPIGGVSNFTGAVNGNLAVTGSMVEPQVVAGLSVTGLASTQDALDELPELDFQIAGGIADGRLFGATAITNYATGHFNAEFGMPCAFSFAPFNYRPDPDAVEVHVDGNLDLAVFNKLAIFQDQLIRGMLRTKVDYVDGAPTGFLKVEGGRYEHFGWGVVFQRFNADLEATPDGFRVVNASATDGGDGTLAMTGGLGKDGLGLRLNFAKAQIIQRNEVAASMSGWLDVSGRLARPDVSGELTIDRAEILLDNIAPPPPPLLTDYDASKTNLVGVAVERERKPPPVGLDIKIKMPAQVFVVASMIDATLEGELHVTDTPKGIAVSGRVEPRRGFVSFIGKKFRFAEGNILLDGAIPTMAILNNLTAEYSRSDVTARLVLNGPANDPSFRLESSPPLPQDEILSQVLFNRDTSSISPYQAYQIAMAARQLSGGLNGPGFMYKVRQAIGVDTLEWREADAADGAGSVAAGKYIGSGLYVEVNRELDAGGQTGLSAEYEVTRHFSIETYTGPKMRPGIGVNWRNDY